MERINFIFNYLFFISISNNVSHADDEYLFWKKVDIKILDKLSSKNKLIKINIGEDYIFKNLILKF